MLMLDLWEQQPGKHFCLSMKSLTGKWTDHYIRRGQWAKAKKLIRDNLDKDLYMCPHGFSEPKRLKTVSVDPCLLYADLDECDPRTLEIRPTIAIESSPGRFVGYWVTDKPASEELNRRLAYSFGADTSGWDRTQVLRVPNTRNYKYESTPRVKILWRDGPEYELDQLERMIPKQVKAVASDEDIEEEAAAIYKSYESKLSRYARRELFSPARPGARSEVLWRLHNELLAAGMSRDEAFAVLWVSPWNKFADRRNGADQLMKELDKALESHFRGKKAQRSEGDDEDDEDEDDEPSKPAEDKKPWNPLPTSLAEVEAENIQWIVPGLLARKELTIIEGDPGVGKSYFTQMLSGSIVDGTTLPVFNAYKPVKGRVIYFDSENTASTITKARFTNNGIINQKDFYQGEDAFTIDDEERWDVVIARIEQLKPELVVFDTINTYIGGADTYRSSETQQAMDYFKQIAKRFDCAVVVLRHLTKGGTGTKALYRGQGSIAFTGSARIVATVAKVPDDDDLRAVACTKNNISAFFKTFTYSIIPLPDTLKETNRSKFLWGDQVDLDADALLTAPKEKAEKSTDNEDAETLIRNMIEKEGRVDAAKVFKKAESRSFSRSLVNRTAEKMGVVRDTTGFGKTKTTWWSLPSA